jgi:hypothetical protein
MLFIILGAFKKLQKVTISVIMSVCLPIGPSVCPCARVFTWKLGSHWTDLHEI